MNNYNQEQFKLCVDLDETVNNMISYLLPLYNKAYNDDIQFNEINEYDITKSIFSECSNFFKEFATNENLSKLSLQENCKETLDYFYNSGKVKIYFATAGFPDTMPTRHIWLQQHFDWYTYDNLIAITNKQLLKCDALIDDYDLNLINGNYLKILVNKPWNKKANDMINGYNRVHNWTEIKEIIMEFFKL